MRTIVDSLIMAAIIALLAFLPASRSTPPSYCDQWHGRIMAGVARDGWNDYAEDIAYNWHVQAERHLRQCP